MNHFKALRAAVTDVDAASPTVAAEWPTPAVAPRTPRSETGGNIDTTELRHATFTAQSAATSLSSVRRNVSGKIEVGANRSARIYTAEPQ